MAGGVKVLGTCHPALTVVLSEAVLVFVIALCHQGCRCGLEYDYEYAHEHERALTR